MATEVIMPKVDMVMDSGTFVEWLKSEGEEVQKGEPLFVVLTDKANIEIEAPASGILSGIRAKPDDEIPVTEVIAYIVEPGEEVPQAAPPQAARRSAPPQPEPVAETASSPVAVSTNGKVRATPAARRVAADLGVDLAQVEGSGPRGRVHKNDVLRFDEQQAGQPSPPVVRRTEVDLPLPEARRKEEIPLEGPRQIIAERMAHSAFTAPHISLTVTVDMSEAVRLRGRVRERIEARTGYKPSFTAILARAVAAALPRHPTLNASLEGEKIVLWADIHLGIAVSLEDYLVVPVIREAQSKGLEQITADLGELAERARAKRLTPAEMSGSTFTISNLGMYGIEQFTAIINPPEAAILAVGQIEERAVKAGDQIELRPMMKLTLSADHRIVDGAAGAAFLAELKATLENPYLLI